MKKTAMIGFGMAMAFGIGCGAGMGASSFVVPPARAGTNPQKWEYMCIDETLAEKLTPKANEMGAQGWELVAAAGAHMGGVDAYMPWCFKRPL